MAEITQYRCDGCGAIKGEANHWWKVRDGNELHGFHLFPFSDIDVEPLSHYCGAACVHKALDAFMGAK